jgi:hypothetical protein
MACAVVSTCMHVEPRGATWSMACAVVSTCMHVEPGHAVHGMRRGEHLHARGATWSMAMRYTKERRTPNVER